jgi:hypothetical protein
MSCVLSSALGAMRIVHGVWRIPQRTKRTGGTSPRRAARRGGLAEGLNKIRNFRRYVHRVNLA